MAKPKLGKGVAALTATGPAILSTNEAAAAADETGAAIGVEQAKYERAVLDFETEVRRHRDAMRAEHLANMQAIFEG